MFQLFVPVKCLCYLSDRQLVQLKTGQALVHTGELFLQSLAAAVLC